MSVVTRQKNKGSSDFEQRLKLVGQNHPPHLNSQPASVFLKHFRFLSHGKEKKNQSRNANLPNTNHSAKWCSVIFLTFETAPDNSMPAPTSFKIQQSKCSPECCWFCCSYWEQYRQLWNKARIKYISRYQDPKTKCLIYMWENSWVERIKYVTYKE